MATDYSVIHALIADGDRHLRRILRDLLADQGISRSNIREAQNGQEAIELLEIRRSHFLIVAQRMSPIDGLTLVQMLRNPNLTPAAGIPVIFCSGQLDREFVRKVHHAGVNEIIAKPVNAESVRRHVSSVLERPRPVITLTDYIGPDRRVISIPRDDDDRRNPDDDFYI